MRGNSAYGLAQLASSGHLSLRALEAPVHVNVVSTDSHQLPTLGTGRIRPRRHIPRRVLFNAEVLPPGQRSGLLCAGWRHRKPACGATDRAAHQKHQPNNNSTETGHEQHLQGQAEAEPRAVKRKRKPAQDARTHARARAWGGPLRQAPHLRERRQPSPSSRLNS
jgi:hypothetical protein